MTSKKTSFCRYWVPLFDAFVREKPFHPGTRNFVTINWSPWGSPQWKFRDPSLPRFFNNTAVWQTDGRTDRRTDTSTMAKTREAFCCRV